MILVTGARGVVGIPLCEKLTASSQKYLAVSRANTEKNQTLYWDLNKPLDTAQLAQVSACNELIHCAPLWLLPEHLSALITAGIDRVVAFSSTSVIAKKNSSDPHDLKLVKTLEQAEQRLTSLAQEQNIRLTILRPSMIYGNGLDENISHIAHRIKRFKVMPLAGAGSGLRQPVHADDLVAAALDMLRQSLPGVKTYNLSGGETLSYRAMVARIFIAMGMRPRFISVPVWLFRLLLRTLGLLGSFDYTATMADRMNTDLIYDFQEATNDFAYEPQNFLLNPEQDLPQ